MASSLSTILPILPTLDVNDLNQLINKAKAAIVVNGGSISAEKPLPASQNGSDYLLEGIHYELRRRGLLSTSQRIPDRRFPSGYSVSSYSARQTLDEYTFACTSAEKFALGKLAIRSLAGWLEMKGIQVTCKSLLVNVGNVPEALDWSFPGYLEARRISLCWRDQS